MSEATNIHPIFNSLLSREKKEELLKQNGIVLWMTGLSGSGKSTLARALEFALNDLGYFTMLLDGDNLRTGVNSNLGFSEEDRMENVRRSAEVSKLFASAGIVTICSLISPTEEIREAAQDIIGKEDFYQVHIDCPFEVCAERDVKGLYKKALAGEIKNFTGLDSPFDIPANPFVRIPTDKQSLEESLKQLVEAVLPVIKLSE
ncbi:adenylyl-sulfate kinase [Flammeovirga kamogawensis]|uniref:Adenylyl-sulfate kinase n=1 Tax=Flammeovirga kamogawensis TaxID=373891 RepID=A0ABX8GVH4_9BACT|nr:adenylyl-sulfate kinase [Flammeovirga kamogawensis]MBB6461661.1 adenylylsulfate kinase [Flammeovirga kamogawensis]QWG07413.1 adenylyl-sulfate kinase [Flammeovirga kamogawensis]TRX69224.1 adenylyl-sulfate kinase [Flammeovirga kamogawensis]